MVTWETPPEQAPSPGYDPNKFFTAACDVRGHGDALRVKFPPEVLRQVQILISSGAFPPYEMVSDFVRDAVHHLLHRRTEEIHDPAISESLAEFFRRRSLQERLDAAARDSEVWPDQRAQFESVCMRLAKDGAWRQLMENLTEIEKVVDAAPEPYRTAMLTDVERWRGRVPPGFR